MSRKAFTDGTGEVNKAEEVELRKVVIRSF